MYIVEADPYKQLWGIWPEQDPAMRSIAIEEVHVIEESPHRLPAQLATKLYADDETGPGYFEYTAVLADGTMIPCLTGGALDFPLLPDGVSGNAIVGVIRGSSNPAWRDRAAAFNQASPEYAWCLYLR